MGGEKDKSGGAIDSWHDGRNKNKTAWISGTYSKD